MSRPSLLLPRFSPPWWLRGGHRQTLAAGCWYGQLAQYSAIQRVVHLPDGDVVVVHEDRPDKWQFGDRVAVLTHGLTGSHQSPLLVRLASKLVRAGIRVFRWDMRGCGAGATLARKPYHAGCSDDLASVLDAVIGWCQPTDRDVSIPISQPEPYLTVFGVSLSGNVVLKYLGEQPDRVPMDVAAAIAVNPPIDLKVSLGAIRRTLTGWYERLFVNKLLQDLKQRRLNRPDAPMPALSGRPRGLVEFDDWYTAPISGFATADEYYHRCSAAQFLPSIRVPTTIITSQDDPMVPVKMFTGGAASWPSNIRLAIAEGGGHVGYIARRGPDPDEFWLDWRVVDLMTADRAA